MMKTALNVPGKENDAPVQAESSQRYTVDEMLALIEPQYRAYKATMGRCITGLTEYAAQLAAQGQKDPLPRFRQLCIEMAEFWGLTEDDTPKGYQEMAERFGNEFDCAVSAARETGDAPPLSEQTRQDILDGLELYAHEMRSSDEVLEPWAVECDVLAESLKEQWQQEDGIGFQAAPQIGGMSL